MVNGELICRKNEHEPALKCSAKMSNGKPLGVRILRFEVLFDTSKSNLWQVEEFGLVVCLVFFFLISSFRDYYDVWRSQRRGSREAWRGPNSELTLKTFQQKRNRPEECSRDESKLAAE